MNDFQTLFPNFLTQCTALNRALVPVAIVLFVVGIVSSTISGQRSAGAYLRTFGRTAAYIAVLALLLIWSGDISGAVDDVVKNTIKADPGAVHADYQKALAMQKSDADDGSWWDLLDGQAIFEGIVSGILWCFGWLAGVIVFYAHLTQRFILYLGYGFAPLFIGFLAVRTLHSIGVSFLMGFAGVLCWPLGWGAAAILTRGLIDFMTDKSLFVNGAVVGGAGYALQNILGVAALGLWLMFSTIAAPVIIQKAITTGTQIGQALAAGVSTAATAGITGGAGAAASLSAGGGVAATLAGIGGGVTVAAVGTAESATSGSTYSPLGSLLGSLASQRSASRRAVRPKKDDPTGDEAVRELLEGKTK